MRKLMLMLIFGLAACAAPKGNFDVVPVVPMQVPPGAAAFTNRGPEIVRLVPAPREGSALVMPGQTVMFNWDKH